MAKTWESLVNQLSIAASEVTKELLHKDGELNLLSELNKVILTSNGIAELTHGSGLKNIAEIIIKGCREITKADSGSFLVMTPDKDKLEIIYSTNPENEGMLLGLDECLSGHEISKPIIRTGNAEEEYPDKFKPLLGESKKSELIARVYTSAKEPRFVINLEDDTPDRFTKNDEEFLSRIVTALELYAQYTEVDNIHNELNHIGSRLTGEDPENALLLLLKYSMEHIVSNQYKAVADLLIYDEHSEKLKIRQSTDASRVDVHVPTVGSVTGRAFTSRRIEKVESFTIGNNIGGESPILKLDPLAHNPEHELAVPILLRDRSIGVINFESEGRIDWNDKVEMFLTVLSVQAPVILSLVRQADRLRIEKAAAGAAGMMARIGEMTQDLIHDLGNQVAYLNTALKLIHERVLEGKDLGDLNYEFDDLFKTVDQVLELPEQFKRKITDITVVDEFVFGETFNNIIAELKVPKGILIHTTIRGVVDKAVIYAEFPEVTKNLITNSIKAIKSIRDIGTIDIITEPVATLKDQPIESFRLIVQDDGPGVPNDIIESIFSLGLTTKNDNVGFGIGLWSIKMFADRCRGSIKVENLPQRGARFTLTLPVSINA